MRGLGFAVAQLTDPSGLAEELGPDALVVILDVKLEDTSDLEVLEEIREQYPHLPVIVVTDRRPEKGLAIEAALEIDAFTCLYKPFEIEDLLRVLGEIPRGELSGPLGQTPPLGSGSE